MNSNLGTVLNFATGSSCGVVGGSMIWRNTESFHVVIFAVFCIFYIWTTMVVRIVC